MFSFTNGLRGVGRGTRSRLETQGEGQRGDSQSIESWQIQGMGDAPRDLSGSRGTTGLGDPGRYSFGEDAGQQGTGPDLGFALPEYGSKLDAGHPSASGEMASGGPGQWARPTTGTGISGISFAQPHSESGEMASGGPGQRVSPTTGTGISGSSFAPVQGASPTTGPGNNVTGVQGPGANAPYGTMPPGSVGTGVYSTDRNGPRRNG